MDIVQERLEREYDMALITTAPSVVYEVVLRDGTVISVENPSKLPDPGRIEEIREPVVSVTIFVPQEHVGSVITLATGKRGVQTNMAYHGRQVHLTYDMPLAEIVLDFFDRLKSVSRGYASMAMSSRSTGQPTWQGGYSDQQRPVDALAALFIAPMHLIAGARLPPKMAS